MPDEWIVELQSIEHPEITVIEIVEAVSDMDASRQAFFTRNIASSWVISYMENTTTETVYILDGEAVY